MSTRAPFEFRAPEPLKSNSQGFHFNPITEQERIGDTLRRNVLFENEQFDKEMLVKDDLFRTSTKKRWVSPKDFNVMTRKTAGFTVQKLPGDSQRAHSTIRSAANRSTFSSHRGQSFCFGAEPFEDPKLDPGFVRTTKDYLKTLHQRNVEKEKKREELALLDLSRQQQLQEQSISDYKVSFMNNSAMTKMQTLNAAADTRQFNQT